MLSPRAPARRLARSQTQHGLRNATQLDLSARYVQSVQVGAHKSWEGERALARVDRLRHEERSALVFGAGGHGFVLFPTATSDEIARFEQVRRVQVPEQYRAFLLEVGNGGAGPGYGLFPLGEMGDTALETKPWMADRGDPSRPFPHRSEWNVGSELRLPPDGLTGAETDEWFAEKERAYFDPRLVDGTIPIAHMGCAIWMLLVATGERTGELWIDDRGSDKGIYPNNVLGFETWYLNWLEAAEATVTAAR